MRSARQRSVLLAIFALAILFLIALVVWVSTGGGSRSGTEIVPTLQPVASGTSTDAFNARLASDLAREDGESAAPERLAPETEPTQDSRRAPAESAVIASSPLRAGTLVVRAYDRTLLGPLRWFNVRIANATRFAERRSEMLAGEVGLPLTPGVYSLFLSSPGYEPVEIPSVEVPSGEVVRLDSIDLRPGSGRIQVQVVGTSDPDRKWRLELLGEGRHPCARCEGLEDALAFTRRADEAARGRTDAESAGSATSRSDKAWDRLGACPECGFARDRSDAWVHSGESFVFANLAGGSYALRLADPNGRTIDQPCQVVLEESAKSSVVFDCSPTRSLEIELIDVDGRSLTQEWSRRIVAAKSSVEIVEGVSEVGSDDAFQLVVIDDRHELARTTLVPPSLDGHRRIRPSAFGGRKLGTGVAKIPDPGQPIDRVRRANESLRPEVRVPFFASLPVECEIGEHGFGTMGPLPGTPLRLRVYAARSEGEVLVPASRDTTRVSLNLHAR